MNKFLSISLLMVFLFTVNAFAQEIKTKKPQVKQVKSGILNGAEKMTVKDSDDNVLMEVNDEGAAGSILLPPLTSITTSTDNKLYNISNKLYWHGSELGTAGSAGGWTHIGSIVHTTTSTDKVGIGTTSPEAAFHVTGNDGVLFGGSFGSGTTLNLGNGTRMMWYPIKAAFRAGTADGTEWDDANIGNYSTAFGRSTTASGEYSVAMGFDNLASGSWAVALGDMTTASGDGSTALGDKTTASGHVCTAIGNNTTASGWVATAIGDETIASGSSSTALGKGTKAEASFSTSIGSFNLGGGHPTDWVDTDPLFEIGNGQDTENRSNALTVLKNGNVGIGIINPGTNLDVSGQIKLSGGSPGIAKVLTSDASGLATWEDPTGAEEINDLSDGKTGGYSVFLGSGAGINDDGTDNYNVGVGIETLNSNTSGSSNTALGHNALFLTNTGGNNTACGTWAMYANTTGSNNTAIGYYSLGHNTEGTDNTAVGFNALGTNRELGRENTAVGSEALFANTNGLFNSALGFKALYSNLDGANNTAVGNEALFTNSTGIGNTAIGSNALYQNGIGNYNVGIGHGTNKQNQDGSNNTIIGYEAGGQTVSHSKSGNVFIGYQAGYSESGSNLLYIDNSNTSAPLIWGDFSSNQIVINGNSSSNPNSRTFFSNGEAGGTTAWNNDSDRRLKKNINTIPSALEKVQKLRGVNFEWKDIENHSKGVKMGFIAQEANEIIPEVVSKSGEYYSMQYAPITALLVEAVKEQEIRFKTQESRIEELEQENKKLAEEVKVIRNAFVKNESLLKQVINELYDKKIEIKVVSTVK